MDQNTQTTPDAHAVDHTLSQPIQEEIDHVEHDIVDSLEGHPNGNIVTVGLPEALQEDGVAERQVVTAESNATLRPEHQIASTVQLKTLASKFKDGSLFGELTREAVDRFAGSGAHTTDAVSECKAVAPGFFGLKLA